MNYYLNAGIWESVFAVPGAVVDKYIKLASGSAVKVLLYVLKNNGRNISRSEISAALNISADDVADAFNFWEGVDILKKDGSTASSSVPETETQKTPASVSPAASVTASQNSAVQREIQPALQTSSASFQVSPSQIDKMRENSKEMKGLFDMAQCTLGGPINHTMVRSLVWQHEYLGLKPDVILMLLSHCASIDKTHTSYIEAIAVRWSREEINTLEKAEAELSKMSKQNSFMSKMSIAFGLKRPPTKNQLQFFDEWLLRGYSAELIECACERTIDLGKTLTVNYINGILENWHKKGITTREQAEAEISSRKGTGYTPAPLPNQSYDLSKFDEFAINFSGNAKKGDSK